MSKLFAIQTLRLNGRAGEGRADSQCQDRSDSATKWLTTSVEKLDA